MMYFKVVIYGNGQPTLSNGPVPPPDGVVIAKIRAANIDKARAVYREMVVNLPSHELLKWREDVMKGDI